MNTQDEIKNTILKELLGTAKGIIPDVDETLFWSEIAEEFANEKIRYDAAYTSEEKEKVASNLLVLKTTIALRLARKQLRVRNSAEGIAAMVLKTVVGKFFPTVGLIGDLAKLMIN